MAAQSPMISIPKKTTEEVDWTTPIRAQIGQSYGENPDSYASECASLQRCRQDAVKGAGSDVTGECCFDRTSNVVRSPDDVTITTTSTIPIPRSTRLVVQVLWSTRVARTALCRDTSHVSMARRIHEQTHDSDVSGVRKGVHHLSDRSHTLGHCGVSEQVRSRGVEASV